MNIREIHSKSILSPSKIYDHVVNPYEMIYSLHMLSVDFLLIWIPFSRISHFSTGE